MSSFFATKLDVKSWQRSGSCMFHLFHLLVFHKHSKGTSACLTRRTCVTSNKNILHSLFQTHISVSNVMHDPAKPTTPFSKSSHRSARLLHPESRSPQPSPSTYSLFRKIKLSPAFGLKMKDSDELVEMPAPTTPERLLELPDSVRTLLEIERGPAKHSIEDGDEQPESTASSPFDSEPEDDHNNTLPESPLNYKVAPLSPVNELSEPQTEAENESSLTSVADETVCEVDIDILDEEPRMTGVTLHDNDNEFHVSPTTRLDEDDTVFTSPIQIRPLEPVPFPPFQQMLCQDKIEDAPDDRRDSFEPLQSSQSRDYEGCKKSSNGMQSVAAGASDLDDEEDMEEITIIRAREPEHVDITKEDNQDESHSNIQNERDASGPKLLQPRSDSASGMADVQDDLTDVDPAFHHDVHEANKAGYPCEMPQIERGWITVPEQTESADGAEEEDRHSMFVNDASEKHNRRVHESAKYHDQRELPETDSVAKNAYKQENEDMAEEDFEESQYFACGVDMNPADAIADIEERIARIRRRVAELTSSDSTWRGVLQTDSTLSNDSVDHLPISTDLDDNDSSDLDLRSKDDLKDAAPASSPRLYFEPILSDSDLVSLGTQVGYSKLANTMSADERTKTESTIPSPAAWWELTLIPAWTPSPDVLISIKQDGTDLEGSRTSRKRRPWKERAARGKSYIPRNQLHASQRGPPKAVLSAEQQAAGSKWASLVSTIEAHDAQLTLAAARAIEAKRAAEGTLTEEYKPVYRETFKKTEVGEVLGSRHVVDILKTVHDVNGSSTEEDVLSGVAQPQISVEQVPSQNTHLEESLGSVHTATNRLAILPTMPSRIGASSQLPMAGSREAVPYVKSPDYINASHSSSIGTDTILTNTRPENVRSSKLPHIRALQAVRGEESDLYNQTQLKHEPTNSGHFAYRSPISDREFRPVEYILPPVNAPVLPDSEYDPWPAGLEAKVLQRVMSPNRVTSSAPESSLNIDTATARTSTYDFNNPMTPLSARSIRDRRNNARATLNLSFAALHFGLRDSIDGDTDEEEMGTNSSPSASIKSADDETVPLLKVTSSTNASPRLDGDDRAIVRSTSIIGNVLYKLVAFIFRPLIVVFAICSFTMRKMDYALDCVTEWLTGLKNPEREGGENNEEHDVLDEGIVITEDGDQSFELEEDVSSDEGDGVRAEDDDTWVRGVRKAAESVVQGLLEGKVVADDAVEDVADEEDADEEDTSGEDSEDGVEEIWWI
jgi:hypothetical protein